MTKDASLVSREASLVLPALRAARFTLLLLGLSLSLTFSLAPAGAAEAPAAPARSNGLATRVIEHRLANGLTVLMVEHHQTPTVSLNLTFRV